MLTLLVFAAALNAADLPLQGRFLLAARNDTGLIVFDDASLTRDGEWPTARVVSGLSEGPIVGGEKARTVQFIEQYDCAKRHTRLVESGIYSDSGRLVEHDTQPGQWSAPPPGSGREASLRRVCDGADTMREVGTDLMTVLRAFWNTQNEQAA